MILDQLLRVQSFRVTREHRGLADVVQAKVQHDNTFHTNSTSTVGWCAQLERVYVGADSIWRDGVHLGALLKDFRQVYSLCSRYDLLHNTLRTITSSLRIMPHIAASSRRCLQDLILLASKRWQDATGFAAPLQPRPRTTSKQQNATMALLAVEGSPLKGTSEASRQRAGRTSPRMKTSKEFVRLLSLGDNIV
jgi:hypothetical protein